MPTPEQITYSLDALVNCGDEILALIDGGTGVGKIRIFDEDDVLLADLSLADPAGEVNILTGSLAINAATGAQYAVASGTASYAQVTDSDNTMVLEMPTAEGVAAVSGYMVLNSLSVISGAEVSLSSGVIG